VMIKRSSGHAETNKNFYKKHWYNIL